MSTQSWSVDVHGVEHEIRVDVDPESGKTAVRVDGRMAAQPMYPADTERRINVAGASYVVRRDGEGFVVDLVDQPPAPPAPVAPQLTKSPARVHDNPIFTPNRIGLAIATLLGILAIRWGAHTLSYWRVQWKGHMGPQARFRVDFPGPNGPMETTQDVVVNGGTISANLLQGTYQDHEYDFLWFELAPNMFLKAAPDATLAKMLDGIAAHYHGTIDRKESHYYDKHDALTFTMRIPAGDGHPSGQLRGRVILCPYYRAVYCMFAFTPEREVLSFDVGEYLRSLTLAEDGGGPS